MSSSVAFSKYIHTVVQSLLLIPKHLHPSKRKPHAHQAIIFHFLLPAPSGNHQSAVSVDLPILHISHNWNPTTRDLLCPASLTWHHVFQVHPQESMCQYFTPFLCWDNIITYYVYTTVCLLILPLVHIYIVSNSGYCEWCCYEYAYAHIYLSSGGVAWQADKLYALTFWETTKLFSTRVAEPFTFPSQRVRVSIPPKPCPHWFSGFSITILLGSKGTDCGFDQHFCNDWCWTFFHVLVGFFGEMSI